MLRLGQVLDDKKRAKTLVTISPVATAKQAMEEFCTHHVGALLVVDDEKQPVGIITHRDILRQCHEKPDSLESILVEDFMQADVLIGRVDDRTTDTLVLMSARHIRHLPVVDSKRVVGMVSMGDILRALYQENQIKIRHLSDHLGGTYGLRVY